MGEAGHNRLRSFVQRVERLREEIDALNADVSEVYKEAKAEGWNVHAMKALISERAKHARNPEKFRELNDFLELYRNALAGGTPYATRVHAKGDGGPVANSQSVGAHGERPSIAPAGSATVEISATHSNPATSSPPETGGMAPTLSPAVPPTNSDPVATASREAGSTGEGGAVYATVPPANHGAELLRKKRTRTPMTESDEQRWERAMADAYPDLRPDYVEKWGGK